MTGKGWSPLTRQTQGSCLPWFARTTIQWLSGPRIAVNVAMGLLALMLCWPTASVSAHRGSAAWTDIVWREDHFQITHRLHAADALRINRHMGGSGELERLEDLAMLALYVDARFLLLNLPSEQSNLITLGAELDDDFAFIYQEWHPEALPETFPAINNGLLIDLIPEAQQFTRIETPKGIEERRR